MGLRDQINKINKSNNPILSSKDSLEGEEIAVILNLIKSSSFNGGDIETIYNLVIKLQNQYTKLEK
jgi:hypothetical protein|tara:strand:+ start:535 stop:732 length:198 start_codon:yes stop_codon:yes gene_type:complete